jgi:hypothetical protein
MNHSNFGQNPSISETRKNRKTVNNSDIFINPQQNSFNANQTTIFRDQPTFGIPSAPPLSIFTPQNNSIFSALPQQPNFTVSSQQPIFTAPPQQPNFAAPSQQPIFTAPSQQPNFTTSSQQPIFSALPQQPNFAAPSQQPIFTASSQQPIFTAPSQQPIFTAPSQQPIFTASSQQPNFTAPSNPPQTQIQTPKKPNVLYVVLGDENESVYLANIKTLVDVIKSQNETFKLLIKEHSNYKLKDIMQLLEKDLGAEKLKNSISYPAILRERFQDCSYNNVFVEAVLTRFFVENMFFKGEIFNMIIISSFCSASTASYIYHDIFKEYSRVIINHISEKLPDDVMTQVNQRLMRNIEFLTRLLLEINKFQGCIYSYWNSLSTNLKFEINNDEKKISDFRLFLKYN